MYENRKFVLGTVIVVLAIMFFGAVVKDKIPGKKNQPSVTPEVKQLKAQDDYAGWTLFRNGYALPIPSDWKNTSDTGGTAILEPGEAVGSIKEISVTVLPDAKAPQGQQFTTQKELEEWSAVKGEVQGDVQKPKNISLDGEPGVMLVDKTSEENKWVAMAWARKGSANVLIRFTGSGTYGKQDMKAVDYIVSHFTFTPTPSSGKNDKE